jgi:hypothetical protein
VLLNCSGKYSTMCGVTVSVFRLKIELYVATELCEYLDVNYQTIFSILC